MRLWSEEAGSAASVDSSPGAETSEDRARAVARHLGIPLHVVDLREEFRRQVVDYLVDEYVRGRTPNPCLACNRTIKFGSLLRESRRLGAELLATGHYVRTRYQDGEWQLLRGRDREKDQSYVLYMLSQTELAATRFPLGELTKEHVRQIAREENLPVAEQPESQEICFIADDDYRRFLEQMVPDRIAPGPILDTAGREIGRHRGLPYYTIGQRKGLGIAASEALYVVALDVDRNAVIAGTQRELGRNVALIEHVAYVSGQVPHAPFQATVKIRYQATETAATVIPAERSSARVRFRHKLRDITPGQSIVFYQNDAILGGGIIVSSVTEPLDSLAE